jgi:hypothetical protein
MGLPENRAIAARRIALGMSNKLYKRSRDRSLGNENCVGLTRMSHMMLKAVCALTTSRDAP